MIYQFHSGSILPLYQQCIDSVKKLVDPKDYAFLTSFPKELEIDPTVNIRAASDILRCHLLANDPTGIWIDTDVLAKSIYVPQQSDKPYSANHCAIMYCNGHPEFFAAMLEKRKTMRKNTIPGWLQHLVHCDYKDQWHEVPTGSYQHLALGFTTQRINFSMIGNAERTIAIDSQGNMKIVWLK
jgi:hypothetical protein